MIGEYEACLLHGAMHSRLARSRGPALSGRGFAPIIPPHKYTTIVHTPVLVSLRWAAQALVICIPIPSGSRYRRDHKTGVYNYYDSGILRHRFAAVIF